MPPNKLIPGQEVYEASSLEDAIAIKDQALLAAHPEPFDICHPDGAPVAYVPWHGACRYRVPARRNVAIAVNGRRSSFRDLWPEAAPQIEASLGHARQYGKSFGGVIAKSDNQIRQIEWMFFREDRGLVLILRAQTATFTARPKPR